MQSFDDEFQGTTGEDTRLTQEVIRVEELSRCDYPIRLMDGSASAANDSRTDGMPPPAVPLTQTEQWWTGVPPAEAGCPGVSADGVLHSLVPPDLRTCTRSEVLDYFNNSWTLSELLFSSLKTEDAFYEPPVHGLRHPLVFYYVHPAALYVNKLRVAGILDSPIEPYYESLFETGVDEMSWDDMSKNTMDWPALHLLHAYRRAVYQVVSGLITSHQSLSAGHPPITQSDPLWALFMAFEHERIHLETSSVLIRELPLDLVTRPRHWPHLHPSMVTGAATSYPPRPGIDYPTNQMMQIKSGQVTLGKPSDAPSYGWDNEYGHRDQHVGEFSVTKNLISNGEFWHFVADGGYHERRYWSEVGWRWRSFRNVKCPTFWLPDGPAGSHRYLLRALFEVVSMPWSCPAIVNYHEAQAYCRWRAQEDAVSGQTRLRLLSESEHHRLRQIEQSQQQYNLNLVWGSESPVGLSGTGHAGVTDLYGNVWQWCVDQFNPLPGFRVHKYYDDFSTPCFDGEHQMIMGGSFISTGAEASPWARFHFRPHFFQHAGFRLVSSTGDGGAVTSKSEKPAGNRYAELDMLNVYLTLHYAPPEVQMPFDYISREVTCFPQRCARLVKEWSDILAIEPSRALDIGCAVGGAAFSMAEHFAEVTAVDLSDNFIQAAKRLQSNREIDFRCKLEGKLSLPVHATVDTAVAERVTFRRADACSLPAEYTDFDAVLIANVLCRVPSPMSCLSRMGGSRGMVRRGGLLVITTPFTWMEQFSPAEVWLGGYMDESGQMRFSEDGLQAALEGEFELLDKFDMPLLIREHHRKYELITSLATVWRRR